MKQVMLNSNAKLFYQNFQHYSFYPTVLKGCLGIVFTHDVRMGSGRQEKVCPGCISVTVRFKKLMLDRDID